LRPDTGLHAHPDEAIVPSIVSLLPHLKKSVDRITGEVIEIDELGNLERTIRQLAGKRVSGTNWGRPFAWVICGWGSAAFAVRLRCRIKSIKLGLENNDDHMKLKFRLLLEHEEKMKLGFKCWQFPDLVIAVCCTGSLIEYCVTQA